MDPSKRTAGVHAIEIWFRMTSFTVSAHPVVRVFIGCPG